MSASKTTDWNSPDDAVQYLRGNGWRFDHKWGWLLPRITYWVNEKEDHRNAAGRPLILERVGLIRSHRCPFTKGRL